jgi:hypothetical protein
LMTDISSSLLTIFKACRVGRHVEIMRRTIRGFAAHTASEATTVSRRLIENISLSYVTARTAQESGP